MKRLIGLGVTVAAAMTLAACGSSEDATPAGTETASASAGSACVTEAQQLADKGRAEIALKAPSTPLDLAKLEGETVWLVNAVDTPLLLEIVDGFKDAAKAAGVKTQIVSAKGSASQMNQGVASAVAQKASGIVLLAVDPRLVDGPLAQAMKAEIPVVDSLTAGPDAPLNGLFAHVDADMKGDGGLVADWVMADSGCKAEMVIFASTVLSVHKLLTEGAQEEMKRLCPECKTTLQEFDSTKMATDLGTSTQSVLRRNPDTNYLFPVLDAGVQFVEPAVAQAGKSDDVKIVSHDGVSTNIANMREGGGQVLDVAFPPSAWFGWAIFDQISRGVLGEEPGDWTVPTRLIDKTNAGTSDEDLFPAYVGFEDEFVKEWKSEGS